MEAEGARRSTSHVGTLGFVTRNECSSLCTGGAGVTAFLLGSGGSGAWESRSCSLSLLSSQTPPGRRWRPSTHGPWLLLRLQPAGLTRRKQGKAQEARQTRAAPAMPVPGLHGPAGQPPWGQAPRALPVDAGAQPVACPAHLSSTSTWSETRTLDKLCGLPGFIADHPSEGRSWGVKGPQGSAIGVVFLKSPQLPQRGSGRSGARASPETPGLLLARRGRRQLPVGKSW